jgi:hypothetical protein
MAKRIYSHTAMEIKDNSNKKNSMERWKWEKLCKPHYFLDAIFGYK